RRFASCGEFAAALAQETPAPPRAATPLRVPVTRAPVAAARGRDPEEDEPTPVPAVRAVPVPPVPAPAINFRDPEEDEPTPVPRPAARTVEARPAPAPVRLAEPKPAAPIEKRAPKLAKKPAPPPPVETEAEEAPPRGKPWRWVLLFAIAGLVALFGSALIGMLSGGSAPKGGAPVTRPGGSTGTRSR
ncbi:MAG TPA: hypothetical protein VEU33_23685, partial [Archangium sp.]|nr:hypothetical protein [Archangium sp.]